MTSDISGGEQFMVERLKTAGFQLVLSAGWSPKGRVYLRNRHATNDATGIKLGTTSGASDIMGALNVPHLSVAFGTILIPLFSLVDTTIFVTGTFNAASIDIKIPIERGIVGAIT